MVTFELSYRIYPSTDKRFSAPYTVLGIIASRDDAYRAARELQNDCPNIEVRLLEVHQR